MGGSWADQCDEEARAGGEQPASKRTISVPLGRGRLPERLVSQCRACGASFYQPGETREHSHCPPCYKSWMRARYGRARSSRRKTTTSPASSRTASTESSDAAVEQSDGTDGTTACRMLADLDKVLLCTTSAPLQRRPLQNSPEVLPVAPSHDPIALLLSTTPPAPLPAALPKPTANASTQTGLQLRRRPCRHCAAPSKRPVAARRADTQEFWASLCAYEGFLRYTAGRQYIPDAFTTQIQHY